MEHYRSASALFSVICVAKRYGSMCGLYQSEYRVTMGSFAIGTRILFCSVIVQVRKYRFSAFSG